MERFPAHVRRRRYLHEAALADRPPSGTFYDPDHASGTTRLESLGVYEHWNNSKEKRYSRNLGKAQGIELVPVGQADIETCNLLFGIPVPISLGTRESNSAHPSPHGQTAAPRWPPGLRAARTAHRPFPGGPFPGTRDHWRLGLPRDSQRRTLIHQEETSNLLKAVENELHNRRKGDAVRLGNPARLSPLHSRRPAQDPPPSWRTSISFDGPLNPTRLMALYEGDRSPELLTPRLSPRWPPPCAPNRTCSLPSGSATSSCTTPTIISLVYGTWLLFVAFSGHDARDFIVESHVMLDRSHISSVIKVDPTYKAEFNNKNGYDGQFAYFIAIDPTNARYYMPDPAYRYTRILYPLLARLLALGDPNLVPMTLILVNFAAIVGGTLIVAAWLRRLGTTPWFALVYGFYPGLFMGLRRDLTEPLAFGLTALAIYVMYFGGRRRLIWSSVCFALAALSREQTAVFPLVIGMCLFVVGPRETSGTQGWPRPTRLQATAFTVASVAPLLIYKLFLLSWLGRSGVPANNMPRLVPFGSLFVTWPWSAIETFAIIAVVVPALISCVMIIRALPQLAKDPLPWCLLANALIFVVLLNRSSYVNYVALGRVAFGVVMTTLLCLPRLSTIPNRVPAWVFVCTGLWLSAWVVVHQPSSLFFP